MSKFKVGDEVVLTNKTYERGGSGDSAEIIHCYNVSGVYRVILKDGDHAGQTCVKFERELNSIKSMYLSSKRYKLSQAIKLTGFHAEKLSLETGHAKTYFTGFTAESRFNSRGDITEERLNSLLTTLAFAERKLLDLAPKNVDENNVPVVEKLIDESVAEAKAALNTFSDNNQKTIELQKKFFESAQNRIQTKKDNKAKKFLIVFVLVLLALALWFFVR